MTPGFGISFSRCHFELKMGQTCKWYSDYSALYFEMKIKKKFSEVTETATLTSRALTS